MKVRGFQPQIITPKPAWYLLSDSLRVLVRHSQAQKCLQVNPITLPSNSYEILKILYLADFSTDWLTDWLTFLLACLLMPRLMPSDKHNLRAATARDVISSLINVASSRDVPFHQPQQLQCLHHAATFVSLCAPILCSQPCKVTICGRHLMASVRGIKIAEALLILCLAYYVIKLVRYCWNWGIMVLRDGARISRAYSPYFLLWLDGLQRCFSWCSLLILLCNGQNITECVAYWLMDKQPKLLCFHKILQSIGII